MDFGARFYDPAVGRWFTPDALAEKYYSTSPFTYGLNNPIIYIDPDGNQVEMCCQGLKDFMFNVGTRVGLVSANHPKNNPNSSRAKDRLYNVHNSGSSTATGPTKNITGNYFGDAVYKLGGGETFSKALDGNAKAQGQVIMNSMLLLSPSKAGVGTSSSKVASSSLQAEVKAVAQNTSKKVSVIVGAELKGSTFIATSGSKPTVIAPSLEKAAQKAGGVGAMNTGAKSPVGCCAEFRAANELLLQNKDALPVQLKFTPAIRPRNGAVIEPCINCKSVFPQLDN